MQKNPEHSSDTPHCCQSTGATDAILHDNAERAALDIMRFYCLSYSTPSSQGWEEALATACAYFGEESGPVIAMRLHAFLGAMRHSRKSVFNFSSPRCRTCRARMMESEVRLMNLFRTARQGQRTEAQAHALILCEGNRTGDVLRAATDAGKALDCWFGSLHPAQTVNWPQSSIFRVN